MDDRTMSFVQMVERIRELETALQPFALAGRSYRHRTLAVRLVSCATGDITVADLVKASEALEGE